MFNTLLQYKERNGNCLVPKNYSPNPYLGAWVHTQRLHYCKLFNFETKLEKSNDENAGKEFREQLKFTPDHKKRLDSIQFCWDIVPITDVEVRQLSSLLLLLASLSLSKSLSFSFLSDPSK